MNSRIFFGRIAAGLALLGSMLAAPAAAQRPAGPALWQVADADTTIYLFGTIHMLPEGTQWRSPAVERAIAQSDGLVLELVEGDPSETVNLLTQTGLSPGLPPLAQRVPPEKKEVLSRIVGTSGVPAASLDSMESWAAALTLISAAFAHTGFKPELGVEPVLTATYRKAGKSVSGLETTAQQLGFLDSLSEEAQRALLAGAVEDPAAAKAELDKMFAAWMAGDIQAIAESFDAETLESPELRSVLIDKRNKAWSDWIAARMAQPGNLFIAVGAGHLAGPGSVLELLKQRGLTATRLN